MEREPGAVYHESIILPHVAIGRFRSQCAMNCARYSGCPIVGRLRDIYQGNDSNGNPVRVSLTRISQIDPSLSYSGTNITCSKRKKIKIN